MSWRDGREASGRQGGPTGGPPRCPTAEEGGQSLGEREGVLDVAGQEIFKLLVKYASKSDLSLMDRKCVCVVVFL